MSKNVNDASLANLKHYEGKWQSGQTRTIRVPIALVDATLDYARQLDNGTKSNDTSDLNDEVQQLKDEVGKLRSRIAVLKASQFSPKSETSRILLSVNLADEAWRRLGDWAEAQGMTLKDYLEVRLGDYLPGFSHLSIEMGEAEVKLYGADITPQPSPEVEQPEAADLLNRLKAKRKKSTASLADIEAVLEILEG